MPVAPRVGGWAEAHAVGTPADEEQEAFVEATFDVWDTKGSCMGEEATTDAPPKERLDG